MDTKRVSIICAISIFSILVVTGTVNLLKIRISLASPGPQYVAPGGSCGSATPCHETIQEAVDAAVHGDIIKVAQGTYTSSLSNVVVVGKAVSVLGGYSTSDWQNADPMSQPSIIEGDKVRRGFKIDGWNIPTTTVQTITLQGLTIQNGGGQFEGGGGISINNATVIVRDCLIISSTSTLGRASGGGILIEFSEAFLINNNIQGNNAERGGGINVVDAQVTMTGNTLLNNTASFGGGLYIFGFDTQVTMNGNRIIGNEADESQGPGIQISGGIVDGRNDVIAQNFSGLGDGEGVKVGFGSLSARHWTVADNDGYGVIAQGGTAYLTNTIVASHTVAALFWSGVEASTTLFYGNGTNCDSGASCTNNLTGDPKFTSPSTGDYHIMASSAALDTGINAGVTTDIDGDPRPALSGYDIGADEFVEFVEAGYWLYLPVVLKLD